LAGSFDQLFYQPPGSDTHRQKLEIKEVVSWLVPNKEEEEEGVVICEERVPTIETRELELDETKEPSEVICEPEPLPEHDFSQLKSNYKVPQSYL